MGHDRYRGACGHCGARAHRSGRHDTGDSRAARWISTPSRRNGAHRGAAFCRTTRRLATRDPVFAAMTRPEDLPLHDDVRRLAAALGRVIQRMEGDEAFETVEALRRGARSRRRGDANAPDLQALLAEVESLSLPLCATAARAFTLFFLLINTAEQVHRVRRSRAYARDAEAAPQPASARW